MWQVLKIHPTENWNPQLVAEFKSVRAANDFCEQYDWQVLDADTGLMFNLFIASTEVNIMIPIIKKPSCDYYKRIDELLSAAREELTPQDMMKLINDLGVVLDMHCDGIRREVESEFREDVSEYAEE